MAKTQNGYRLPDGLKIGERFLLSFDDPEISAAQHLGRIQDLSSDGYLCIDAPADLSPPQGAAVTVRALPKSPKDYSFSSEIFGRRRLNDRVPVLLLKLPRTIDGHQRRGSYRVAVTLKALAEWEEAGNPGVTLSKPAVVTNLSGGGAQVFVRQSPAAKSLRLTLSAPEEYVEQAVRRRMAKRGRFARPSMASTNLSTGAERDIRRGLEVIEARIVNCRLQTTDGRGPVYALAVSFNEPQESCFNLVRFLERHTVGKGLATSEHPLANAA